jgi:hypothetical protein
MNASDVRERRRWMRAGRRRVNVGDVISIQHLAFSDEARKRNGQRWAGRCW